MSNKISYKYWLYDIYMIFYYNNAADKPNIYTAYTVYYYTTNTNIIYIYIYKILCGFVTTSDTTSEYNNFKLQIKVKTVKTKTGIKMNWITNNT